MSHARRSEKILFIAGDSGFPADEMLQSLVAHGHDVRSMALPSVAASFDEADHRCVAGDDPVATSLDVADPTITCVIAYADDAVAIGAEVARHLRLPGPNPTAITDAQDKLQTRRLLRRAGIDDVAFVAVDAESVDRLEVGAFLSAHGSSVVKPARGAGSKAVVRVDTLAELRAHIRNHPGVDQWLLEEHLGTTAADSSGLADYLSVELVETDGQVVVLGCSDRLPTSPPFRETGVIFPSLRDASTLEPAIELARTAVEALGIHQAFAHVEIKISAGRCSIVEVNPRVGGPLPWLWRAVTDQDFAGVVVDVACGRPLHLEAVRGSHAAEILIYADGPAGRLQGIDGLDRLATLPGVVEMWPIALPGDLLDPALGDLSATLDVFLVAPDGDALRQRIDEVKKTIRVRTAPTEMDRI